MDYLVIEGYKDAADCFSKESGLKPFVDSDSILNRMIIRGAIQRGDIDDAIGRVNELDPEVCFPLQQCDVSVTAVATMAYRTVPRMTVARNPGPLLAPASNDDKLFHAPRLATGSSGSLCADNFLHQIFIYLTRHHAFGMISCVCSGGHCCCHHSKLSQCSHVCSDSDF